MNEARGATEWQDTYGGGFGLQGAQLTNVPVELLDPWEDQSGNPQPFRAYSAEQMQELTENIRQLGIITPLRVRPMGRRFQILAGHNRCEAARRLGLRTVPAMVENVDDDKAAVILVDSNLQQRQELLPSEKAHAYKLKMDSQKHQGKRTDLTSCKICTKSGRADFEVANHSGESARTIQNYIRLNYLIPPLLDMVDAKTLKLIAGVELSFLPAHIQDTVRRLMLEEGIKISTAKAALLHKAMPNTEASVRAVLLPKPKAPILSLKIELPELSELQYAQLSANDAFQTELRRTLLHLAAQYLDKESRKI